ncbi:MAG: DnaB-like helicase C-terminal domain-containing protein, partial [Ginsengibacter sp.]
KIMFKKNVHYSPDLETEILGACLLEPSAFSRVYGILEAATFYSEDHQMIYSCMLEMFENNMPISILSMMDYLIRRKRTETISENSTAYYLTHLTTKVTSTANIEYYSIILKQMWIDREIVLLTSSGVKDQDSRKEIYNLQQKLLELSSINYASDWRDMDELMIGLMKHQEEMIKSKGVGLLTGFPTIDRLYGGFFKGQMIVIGARPSIGKSAFAGNMAMNMATKGNRVGFVSLEMNNNEIAGRFAAIDTDIPFTEIFRGLYQDENQRDAFYQKVNNSTSTLPISVTDKTDLNIPEIKAKAFKLKHEKGRLDCLIIDYLQLVDGDSTSNRNRENEVAKISRGFKIIASELEVPLIVLCQLNREVEKRKGKDRYPQLSDFRESGAIEQDADVAMFLHSDFKSGVTADEFGNTTENQADIVIRKWRNGIPNLIIPLDFDGPKMKFTERRKTGFVPVKSIGGYQGKNPF